MEQEYTHVEMEYCVEEEGEEEKERRNKNVRARPKTQTRNFKAKNPKKKRTYFKKYKCNKEGGQQDVQKPRI